MFYCESLSAEGVSMRLKTNACAVVSERRNIALRCFPCVVLWYGAVHLPSPAALPWQHKEALIGLVQIYTC